MKCPKCRQEGRFTQCTCGAYMCEGTVAMGHRRRCDHCGTPYPPDPPVGHDSDDPYCECRGCFLTKTRAMEEP